MANTIGFNNPVSRIQPFPLTNGGALTTKTYHGLELVFDDHVVGRIKSWNPSSYSRDGNHVYELNVDSFGRPVDFVPGVAQGFSIAMTRVEVWQEELEVAIGMTSSGNVWEDLTAQTRPFTIDERLWRGSSLYRHWKYLGCWFTAKNEGGADAQGDGIYTVDCEIKYIQRVLVG